MDKPNRNSAINMSALLIKTLIPHLPRYAEEEGDFYSVPRIDLINVLCSQHGIDYTVAKNTIDLLENLLNSLSVLQSEYLAKGEWCFVSFPAQLMALSVLTAMSDKESRFFAANFWNTQSIPDAKKEQQRDVLSYFENQRVAFSKNAQPIRYIYVAWAIIKLNDRVLFHQREDTKKRFDNKAGDYGLIGGRLNQTDMHGFEDIKSCLQVLQSNNLTAIKPALTETLKRELSEEAGLVFETHYSFKPWRSLKPYRQVQGAAPNHALTEYYLDIFQIDLTLEGYLFLQQQIKTNDRLVWFSIDDMVKGETVDGKQAYIKALFADYADDKDRLKADLLTLPNSFSNEYLFKREKYGITLLLNTDKPLLAGVLGKEKILDIILTARQQQILLAFAAHNRGFEFITLVDNIVLHPFGWIEVNDLGLQKELIELASLFSSTELIIENHRDRFFRWSISPDILFFDKSLFTYTVSQADLNSIKSKVPICITRLTISTVLGEVASQTENLLISLNLAAGLHKLNSKHYSTDNDEAKQIEDLYKKSLHQDEQFLALGLKTLLRRHAGVFEFCVPYQLSS